MLVAKLSIRDELSREVLGGMTTEASVYLTQQSPLFEGGPSQQLEKWLTRHSWWFLENYPHCVVLYTLKLSTAGGITRVIHH